jgi:hypothetical protein
MLPGFGSAVRIARLAGMLRSWRRHSEDDLNMAAVDLDPSDQRADEVSLALPIELVQTLVDLGRELFEPADDQAQLALALGCGRSRLPPLLELRAAGLEASNAGLELAAVDHPLGIAVDQPADAALKAGDLSIELGHVVG